MALEILRAHVGDLFTRNAVTNVLNGHHDGKIKQSTLDFYRASWTAFNKRRKSGGEVLFLIAVEDDTTPVGISACAVPRKDNKVWNSLTVVSAANRNTGIGKLLLKTKLECISELFPEHNLRTFVSKQNEQSIALCKSSGLKISGEGEREREGKPNTEFFIFSQKK